MVGKTIFDKDYKDLVTKISKARVEAGFTQKHLAKKLGKTQSYISKIESAQIRIDVLQLRQIAKVLGKDISYFL